MIFVKTSHTLAFCIGLAGLALVMAEMSAPTVTPPAGTDPDTAALAEPAPAPAPPGSAPEAVDESWYEEPAEEPAAQDPAFSPDAVEPDPVEDVITGTPSFEDGAPQEESVER